MMSSVPGNYQYWALHQAGSIRRSWHRNKFRLIELVMPTMSSDFVIDAGCGSGTLSAFLADSCRCCIGIDVDTEAIRFASEMFATKKNLRFIGSNLIEAPIGHNTVDRIYFIEVIEHLSLADASSMLEVFGCWLKRGGQLLITTPNYTSFWPFLEWFSDTFSLSPRMVNEQHVTKFSPESLSEILAKSGFSIDRLGSFDSLSPFVAPFSRKLSCRLADWEIMSGSKCGNVLYAKCTRQ